MEKHFAQRGTIRHDLAERAQFDWLSEKMGGETLLKKKYPELYKILLHTRERHTLRAESAGSSGIPEEMPPDGLRDSMKIRYLSYHSDQGAATVSSIHTVEESPSLFMVGNLKDSSHGQMLGRFAECKSNSHELFGGVTFDAKRLCADDSYRFSAETTFVKVCKDENGKPYFDSMSEQTSALKSAVGEDPVKQITVADPRPRRHPGAEKTVVYYNNRQGNGCDYYYDNVDIDSDRVQIYMPFTGSIEFNNSYRPLFVDKNYGFNLHIENMHGGAAYFNSAYWKEIKWEINGSTLSWKFPDYWHTALRRSQIEFMENLNFYCKMYIMAENIKRPAEGRRMSAVITNGDSVFDDPAVKVIEKLEIQWGCFAKDTEIRMADGSMKQIQDIRPEDRIMTSNGVGKVLELISGEEEKMVRIGSGRGHRIMVTKDHPVMTEDGWKQAQELTAGDILIMEYGKDNIEELYICEYHDRVFSLRTEGDGTVIAEGFFMGDFGCQNNCRISRENKTPVLEAFQEEMSDLASELKAGKEADGYGK